MKKVCIIGASGKLGQYMVQYALDRKYKVVGVCREQSVKKLEEFKDQMTIIAGMTNDRAVIKKAVAGWFVKKLRYVDLDDQVEAYNRIFASDSCWTVIRGSDLEEGASQGVPVWSDHGGDPILESNLTRRIDFTLFMVEALENEKRIQKAPAIVGCRTPSAMAHKSN